MSFQSLGSRIISFREFRFSFDFGSSIGVILISDIYSDEIGLDLFYSSVVVWPDVAVELLKFLL